ncbi:MAG: hypothetical protein E7440_00570 [Ruminococcaceae bacterium]|nr:hypothetical protein [Oscillospiraceae bacterium]
MYYKQRAGTLLSQKSADSPGWVQWMHHPQGKTHCAECLLLDGCFFTEETHPPCPHHPFCHCTLEPIDYAFVLGNARVHSDYGKFDPYLFNTTGTYTHNKEKLFNEWGYYAEDASWLQAEIEKQAREKYLSGDYTLGKLNERGQLLNIRILIPRKNTPERVSFITGWMIMPNGTLKLNTPYGGK